MTLWIDWCQLRTALSFIRSFPFYACLIDHGLCPCNGVMVQTVNLIQMGLFAAFVYFTACLDLWRSVSKLDYSHDKYAINFSSCYWMPGTNPLDLGGCLEVSQFTLELFEQSVAIFMKYVAQSMHKFYKLSKKCSIALGFETILDT